MQEIARSARLRKACSTESTSKRNELLDVILHILLEFQRQIAQVQVAFLVVPGNNLGTGTVFSVFTDPRSNLVVGRSGGDKGPEIVIINLCKFQPALIERAIGVVFAFPTHKHRAAFVYSTRRQHIASQRLARASRELFPIAQIAGE